VSKFTALTISLKKTPEYFHSTLPLQGMIHRFFGHTRIRQLLTLSFVGTTLLCIIPEYPLTRWWNEQAEVIALVTFLLSLFFLVIDKSRLMFVCIGCSAAICFYHVEVLGHTNFSEQSIIQRIQNPADSIPVPTPLSHEPEKTNQ
jgi:hypothetical protein